MFTGQVRWNSLRYSVNVSPSRLEKSGKPLAKTEKAPTVSLPDNQLLAFPRKKGIRGRADTTSALSVPCTLHTWRFAKLFPVPSMVHEGGGTSLPLSDRQYMITANWDSWAIAMEVHGNSDRSFLYLWQSLNCLARLSQIGWGQLDRWMWPLLYL